MLRTILFPKDEGCLRRLGSLPRPSTHAQGPVSLKKSKWLSFSMVLSHLEALQGMKAEAPSACGAHTPLLSTLFWRTFPKLLSDLAFFIPFISIRTPYNHCSRGQGAFRNTNLLLGVVAGKIICQYYFSPPTNTGPLM